MITPGALLDPPKLQLFDDDGAPAGGFSLYTYEAGTSTPLDTYADSDLTVANSNPIVLDDAGRSVVYLQPSVGYKFVLRDLDGVLVWTQDNVVDLASLLYGYLISTEGSKGVSSGYVITDDDIFVTVNSTGANPTVITLPAASTRTKPVIIKNIGPNPVSIVRAGADTIEGAVLTSIGLPAASSPLFPTMTLLSDQSSIWWVTNSVGGVTSGGGGGTGSSSLLQATVTLTDAQIKALPTTPITLVAAPGASLRAVPLAYSLRFDLVAAYTNIDADGFMAVQYGGGSEASGYIGNDSGLPAVDQLTQFLSGIAPGTVYYRLPAAYWDDRGAASDWGLISNPTGTATVNQPLQITIDNGGSGNLTGGNSGNTVRVTTYYAVEAA